MKLPAYGKSLIEARRGGARPVCVHLVIGKNWRASTPCLAPGEDGHPLLALHPDDACGGRFDFRLATGLGVAIADQDGLVFDRQRGGYPEFHMFGPFYALLGELARWAAEIEIHAPGAPPTTASMLAYLSRDYRLAADPDKNHGWPEWWSAEIEQIHAQRRDLWQRALRERLGQHAERL